MTKQRVWADLRLILFDVKASRAKYTLQTQHGSGSVLDVDLLVITNPIVTAEDRRVSVSLEVGRDCTAATPVDALRKLADWMRRSADGIDLALSEEADTMSLPIRCRAKHVRPNIGETIDQDDESDI